MRTYYIDCRGVKPAHYPSKKVAKKHLDHWEGKFHDDCTVQVFNKRSGTWGVVAKGGYAVRPKKGARARRLRKKRGY